MQFRKLERIEIGGNKGRSLSASVVQIYSDFNGLLEVILNLPLTLTLTLTLTRSFSTCRMTCSTSR